MTVSTRRSVSRRMLAASASMVLVLGTLGVALSSRADSPGRIHDSLSGRHGGAIISELPIIRAHGPRQVPKVGRIALGD